METYTLPFFPPNIGTVHVAYFEDVINAATIRKRLVDAARTEGTEGDALRSAVDFAFVDAELVSVLRGLSGDRTNEKKSESELRNAG